MPNIKIIFGVFVYVAQSGGCERDQASRYANKPGSHELPAPAQLGVIDGAAYGHYKTMAQPLTALRFISESDSNTDPSTKMFEQFPEAVVDSYPAFYYSSMERSDNFQLSKSDKVFNIPQMKVLAATLSNMYGNNDPSR